MSEETQPTDKNSAGKEGEPSSSCNALLSVLWEVGEVDNAFLVQSVETCRTCKKHKATSWIGKSCPDAKQQAQQKVDEVNRAYVDPASQVDARFSGIGCDHRGTAFRLRKPCR